MPKKMLEYFMNVFELSSYDLLPEGRYHNNSDFFKFPDFGLSSLKDPVLAPLSITDLEEAENIFDVISEKDYFIHVPYQSYESVIKFFENAAIDPNVTHIKIIQYRVASQSRIMEALRRAVKNGKQVSTFIELKARFDEEANLKWGEFLEKAGVSVYYSMPGLKVHSKLAMVRRIEDGLPKLYAYFSTGNFHEGTAKVYSDIGIFTANQQLNSEAARIFSYLETKQLPSKSFQLLGVGMFNLKEKFIDLVKREIKNAKNGKSASCILKMNTLEDKEMIDLLYEAGREGVKIQLNRL
jgi:polyphosphate kinase